MIKNIKLRNIGILYNPISGRGESLATAHELHALLQKEGYISQIIQSQPKTRASLLFEPLERLDALVALGGDGTLLGLLDTLLDLQLPIYLMPFGNECLFSKEFGMSKNPEKVLEAIKANTVLENDVAIANGERFFTMLSIGFDSEVVHKVSKIRTGPINKMYYLRAILKCIFAHVPPEITLSIDSEKIIDKKKGFLNIANTKQYALGILFNPKADAQSRSLTATFIPYNTSLSFLWQTFCFFLKKGSDSFELPKGQSFEISLTNKYPIQVDGDPLFEDSSFTVRLDERKLQTLAIKL